MTSSPVAHAVSDPGDLLSRILAVVATCPPNGGIEVTGDGPLATRIRAALGAQATSGRSVSDGQPASIPACIVETTGLSEVIGQALTRLADLGLLVLVGPPCALALNLYPDVHVRGLRLVGVAGVGQDRSVELTLERTQRRRARRISATVPATLPSVLGNRKQT